MPENTETCSGEDDGQGWAEDIFRVLQAYRVTQACYVPDGGHIRLIERLQSHRDVRSVPLTTEEEGVALCAGAWLGGARSVLLMQSSGVGNCVNMLSLIKHCRFPFLTLITMRGEWGEFNPWQVPMGSGVEDCLKLMDVNLLRATQAAEVGAVVDAAARMAYLGGLSCAVLLSQRLIGAKDFSK